MKRKAGCGETSGFVCKSVHTGAKWREICNLDFQPFSFFFGREIKNILMTRFLQLNQQLRKKKKKELGEEKHPDIQTYINKAYPKFITIKKK